MPDIPEARPASTVVLLRDSDSGLETLLLKRNKALLFAGGLWVFPGGALDPEDFDGVGVMRPLPHVSPRRGRRRKSPACCRASKIWYC